MKKIIAFMFMSLCLPVCGFSAPLEQLGNTAPPAHNLETPAKVELGKKLFFDRRLSGDGTMSCATCHLP